MKLLRRRGGRPGGPVRDPVLAGLPECARAARGIFPVYAVAATTLAGVHQLLEAIAPLVGTEFIPQTDQGFTQLAIRMTVGSSLARSDAKVRQVEQIVAGFPEVKSVFGKAGRAESSTDPAPFSMFETTIVLKPESAWRPKERWYSAWPEWLKPAFRPFAPDHISYEELIDEMDRAVRSPGVTNAWTMPIKGRIDMLSTGVRTPVGIKIFGNDLKEIERVGERMESILRGIRGTRSVYAERVAGGYFVDVVPRRDQLARYGLTIEEMQMVIGSAIGGENVSTTIEGRERYPVNVRYPRELRDEPSRLARVLVATPTGAQVPLAQIADIQVLQGPSMLRDENGFLAGYVYVDVAGRDIGGYVEEAKQAVRSGLELLVYPAIYKLWKWRTEVRALAEAEPAGLGEAA